MPALQSASRYFFSNLVSLRLKANYLILGDGVWAGGMATVTQFKTPFGAGIVNDTTPAHTRQRSLHTEARSRTKRGRLTLSHPDCTVGPGISPDPGELRFRLPPPPKPR